MRIIIRKNENPNNIPFELKDIDLGLNYVADSRNVFDVVDEQLFFLAVVKYGISFEEVHSFNPEHFYNINLKLLDLPSKDVFYKKCSMLGEKDD